MAERHIPRKVRILGEITLTAAGIATAATGAFIVHKQPERATNKIVAGSIVMLAGGTLTMTAGGMLVREEPDPNP